MRRLLTTALVFASLTAAPLVAQQSAPYHLEIGDTAVYLAPGGYHAFGIELRNASLDLITVAIERTRNELPGGEWTSAVCTGLLCFPPNQDRPDPVVLGPGESVHVELSVATDPAIAEAVGRFALTFSSGGHVDTVNFTATATSVSAVPSASVAAVTSPNQVSEILRITSPLLDAAERATLAITSADGRVIRSIETAPSGSALMLDVQTLPAGKYFYRVETGRGALAGDFVVVR